MTIGGASEPVVRLAIFDRQQPHGHIRPQWEGSLWPTPWHHNRLTNPEPMSRHGGYLGWQRTEGNGGWQLNKTGGVARSVSKPMHVALGLLELAISAAGPQPETIGLGMGSDSVNLDQ